MKKPIQNDNQNSINYFNEFTSSSNKQKYIKPEEIANLKKLRLSDAIHNTSLDLNNYDLSFYIHTNQQKLAEQEVKCQVAMAFKKNHFPLEKLVVKILTSTSKQKINEQAKENFVEEFVLMDQITENDKDLFVNAKSFQQIKGGYMISLEAAHCSLGDILQQRKKAGVSYTEEELFYIFFDLVRGFALMENCGFAHCDIKPNNIFLFLKNGVKNYVVYKIGDFGCTMNLGEHNNIEAFQRKGLTKGYVPKDIYMKNIGAYNIYLCDVYSLGKTMMKTMGFRNKKELKTSQKYPVLSEIILKMLSTNEFDRPRFAEIVEKIKNYKKIRANEEDFLIMYKNDLDELRKKFIGKEINDMEGIEILRGFQNHMTPYNHFQILEMFHKALIKSQGMFLVDPDFSTSLIEGFEFIINALSFYKKEEWQETIEYLTFTLNWLEPLFQKFTSYIIQSFFSFCLNFVMIKLYRLQKKNKEFSQIVLESEFLTFNLFKLQTYIYENNALRTLIQDPDDIFIRLGIKEYFDAKTYDISKEKIEAMKITNQQQCELYLYKISFDLIKAFFYIERKETL